MKNIIKSFGTKAKRKRGSQANCKGILSSVSSNASFDGSPGSSAVSTEPFISVQFYKNISERSHDGPAPGSESPNMVEQVSGSSSDDENVWVP